MTEPPPLGSCTLPNGVLVFSPSSGPSLLPYWSSAGVPAREAATVAAATPLRIYLVILEGLMVAPF